MAAPDKLGEGAENLLLVRRLLRRNVTPKASASEASVSKWATRSPRSIIERKDTEMRARSAKSSCVHRSERWVRSSRIR